MPINGKLQHWLNSLHSLIKLAMECNKNCPLLHRLNATAHGVKILIEKQQVEDEHTDKR